MGLNEFIRIGSRIKNIRKEKGFTQREMAKRLDLPFSTYSNYENDNREPSFEILNRIAKILELPVALLIADEVSLSAEAQLYDRMSDYLDELGLSVNQSGESQLDIDSASGTVASLSSEELTALFQRIADDAEKRTDKYIRERLKTEFLTD
jgi:Predicted transcriptional regulators